jgi:hypothetical protein
MPPSASEIAERAGVTPQLLLDTLQQGPRSLIGLFPPGSREVYRKSVQMIEDGSANLFVRGVSRPEVQRRSASGTWDASKRRRTKLLAFGHQKAGPASQILKKLVELLVQFMISRDLPISLLDVRHHVNDLTQSSVE